MKINPHRTVALAGALALALPGAAMAKGDHGQGHGKANGHAQSPAHGHANAHRGKKAKRNLNFHGTVVSVDSTTMTAVVHVTRGNRGARDLVGQDVTVDASKARTDVADVNKDGATDLKDVAVGDVVVVQVKLAKGATASQPLPARHITDETSPEQADAADAPESSDSVPTASSPSAG